MPLPWTDIYVSLKTGVIEGCDGPIESAWNHHFQEVTTALVLSRHMYTAYTITIRESLFSKLSKEDQDLIKKAVRMVIEKFRKIVPSIEAKNLKGLKK